MARSLASHRIVERSVSYRTGLFDRPGTDKLFRSWLDYAEGDKKGLRQLKAHGIDTARLRELNNILSLNPYADMWDKERIAEVHGLSAGEARRQGSLYITPYHLLIGLRLGAGGIPAEAMDRLGIVVDRLRSTDIEDIMASIENRWNAVPLPHARVQFAA